MDPLTHALSGAVIKNLGFSRKGSLGVLIFSTVAPDADFITRLWGADVFLRHHRGVTHGVLALILVPLLVGYALRKKGGFAYFWLLSTVGYGLHIALDLTNSYGVRLLAPLDESTFTYDLNFIVDPYVFLIVALAVFLGRFRPDRARAVAAVAVASLVLYTGVKRHFHASAEEFLRADMDEYVIEKVVPMPNSFLRWWFIARDDREIRTGFADLFTRKAYTHRVYPKAGRNPLVEGSKKSGVVKNFLYFAQYPYAEVSADARGSVVRWRDLTYAYAPGDHFTAIVRVDARGNPVSAKVKI